MLNDILRRRSRGETLQAIANHYGRSRKWVKLRIDRGKQGVQPYGSMTTCYLCGKEYKLKRSRINRNNHSFCSRDCYANYLKLSMVGSNNHQWKGGRALSEMIRKSPRNKQWIRQVLNYYHYTCQHCGLRGVELNVHHKCLFSLILNDFLCENEELSSIHNKEELLLRSQKYEPFFDFNNGVALCVSCHRQEHSDNYL